MTTRQAVEILDQRGHRGLDWFLWEKKEGCGPYRTNTEVNGHHAKTGGWKMGFHAFEAIAIAEKYERDVSE